MELFIIQANIERYKSLLVYGRDPKQQAVLRSLLQAELEKLSTLEHSPRSGGANKAYREEPPASAGQAVHPD